MPQPNDSAFLAEFAALYAKYHPHKDPGPPPVVYPTQVDRKDDLVLYSDGSVGAQAFEDYFKSYTGTGHLIHNFFFTDNDQAFQTNPAQAANIAYNRANVYGPLGQMITSVDGMLQGFSASFDARGHFDPKSVRGLDYSRASRESVSKIPDILAVWKATGYFPTVVEQTWTVV
jgi:hypothetical protein